MKPYSVTRLNSYIKNMFTQDFLLSRISVRGEVSNCTYHRSGHIYFTLKDERSAIACVMFASARSGLAFTMQGGDRVVVTGSVDVFERDGRYQLYARKIEKEGAGELYERFLRLKEELEEMGMFAPEYKRPIPSNVKRLGIVTAPTGAAVRDIQNIALRRNPYIQLILFPALVQGEGAKESIARGIAVLDALGVDCIIVGRGGGSIEDLWAFNEELVARAIFQCETPVISAVGHETDTTIADYVADLRAPTPSAAAELAVQDINGVFRQIGQYEQKLQMLMDGHLSHACDALRARRDRILLRSPENRLRQMKDQLRAAQIRIRRAGTQQITEKKHTLQLAIRRLEGLSPLAKLEQGYARAVREDGGTVNSVEDVNAGAAMSVYVRDGLIRTRVLSSEKMTFESEDRNDARGND